MSIAWLATVAILNSHPTPSYLDTTLKPAVRSADLVSRMTLMEKIGQMQHVAPAIPRLGIPAYTWWSEALHGAVGSPVTVFPQAIGLSASFDANLVGDVARAISDEGRARYQLALKKKGLTGMHEGLDFWAPNINIFRDPRWGRGQETYGEDPYLTSRMAVAYVRGLQGVAAGRYKAIATPKHFAVHSGPDPERHRFNAVADPRDIWNTYLPAFRAAVVEGGARSIMSAYSALNGKPDSASEYLLKTILRDAWGFHGYVVSDCGAIPDIVSGHKAAANLAEADALAVYAGCDLECGDAYQALKDAVNNGLVSEQAIDTSVQRLYEARIRLGMFDNPTRWGPWGIVPPKVIDSPAHRNLARRAAQESIVLLKNSGILPLRGYRRIAVIGPNAEDAVVPLGNYNGTPSKTVTVLQGIRAAAPKWVHVSYAQGAPRMGEGGTPIPAKNLVGGVKGEYFVGEDLKGSPAFSQRSAALNFDWGEGSPGIRIPPDRFSARWSTVLVPDVDGQYQIGTRTDDGSRLWVNDRLVIDDWNIHPAKTNLATVSLRGGQAYQIRMEFFEHSGQASAALLWAPPKNQEYAEATQLAEQNDLTILVLGLSGDLENEELDRTSLDLPAPQKGLLNAVLATGKPVVVVLESGSCLTVSDPRIKGILQAWYPGEEGGTAIAAALFGRSNPSGRLPITFYQSLDQVPPFRSYKMENRTYRYLHQRPLYPFGYGLSYTTFAYGQPQVRRLPQRGIIATVTVKNTGKMEGDEVVQVYASHENAIWPEPVRKLVAFQRVHLKRGQSKKLSLLIRPEGLAQSDGKGQLSILPGTYVFNIGGGQPGLEPDTSGFDQPILITFPSLPVPNRMQRAD